MVRLAAGLDAQDCLDDAVLTRALDCLARFGERLRDIPTERLRIVGTNTLRKAQNPVAFIAKAQTLLGHEIDIISGVEEARLIYVGASRMMPATDGEQLFIDIGGGSTEIAAGTGFQPQKLQSLHLGCVAMSRDYFPDRKITATGFVNARTAARLELRPVVQHFRNHCWERVAGASGTIRATANVLRELGYSNQVITVAALEKLIQLILSSGHIDDVISSGMSAERIPVFPGGIAILIEVMKELGIDELAVTQGALREGILFDLIGRSSEQDARIRTVCAMEQRYHVDTEQADRVELTANILLDQVADDWQLDQPMLRQLLSWAARLHEIGLAIAHAQYHRHSAYLLEHSDMPGFNRSEQRWLAGMVGAHRRKLAATDIGEAIPKGLDKLTLRLAILLRLAVLFNRSRSYGFPDLLSLAANECTLKLGLSNSWLTANPLTLADIEREQEYLKLAGFDFQLINV